ncbi:4-hydroxybutyrate--acetyl-CoA CoA transferase [Ruminococcaceae bacterium OttesenSCG-928-A16]|nr:4-hydroxybutyrate--acetyl-CoA CoA transferase [Ruminococcaceae bacterium OttesenSCG-928-A16]
MSTIQEQYSQKKKTTAEALELIESGDVIITGLGAAEPVELLNNIHTIAQRGVKGCDLTSCLPVGMYDYILKPDYADSIFANSWFYGAASRKAGAAPNTSHVPQRLSLAFKKRNFARKQDGRRLVLLTSCSPMDEHGYLSLSLSVTYEREAIDEGAFVIVEVNPNLPRTFGDATVHISEIDALVEVDYPATAIPEGTFTDKDKAIAEYIAERIEDGSTIQLGIGGIPNALAAGLKGKRNLGIHTEMITDGMVDLVECGAVNGSMKTLYKHKIVGTFAMGSQKLYDFMDNNPSIVMKNGNWTNDPCVIGQNHKMVSINTTMEIDFFGQCASEAIGPVQFSGTGGQADTAIGAQRSVGGKSFIALYSTANVKNENGDRVPISKIVPLLKPGSVVSLSRNDVDYVVTEYGIASLQGRSVKERVERLIAIAHPDFREELRFEAKKQTYY